MREDNITVVLGHTLVFVFPFQTFMTQINKWTWNVIFFQVHKKHRDCVATLPVYGPLI